LYTIKDKMELEDISTLNNYNVRIAFSFFNITWIFLSLMGVIFGIFNKKIPFCCLKISEMINFILLTILSILTLPLRGFISGYNLGNNCMQNSLLNSFMGPFTFVFLSFSPYIFIVVYKIADWIWWRNS